MLRLNNKATKEDLGPDRELGPTTVILIKSLLDEGHTGEDIAKLLNRDVDMVEALIALGEKKGWDELRTVLESKIGKVSREGFRKSHD